MNTTYLSGPPGSGKSTLLKYFSDKGYKTYSELVDEFPKEVYPNPRDFSTAKYIFEQNVKRDFLIRKSTKNVIVDRYPLDCLCIAKGLLNYDSDFKRIENLYLEYDFFSGRIVELYANSKLIKNRFLSKKVKLITEDMIDDIYIGFDSYPDYIKSDIRISSLNSVEDNVAKLLSYGIII